MNPIIALTDFQVVLPKIQMDQQTALDYTVQAHEKFDDSREVSLLMKRYGVKPKQISQRYAENTEIPLRGGDILERNKFFSHRAEEVFCEFYNHSSAAPNHIVHVTCTGYVAPSPAQFLVNKKSWSEQTQVTHAYHMGCYASLPAIRMAEGFVASRNANVDVVHTEMCGLHMDRSDHTPEQLVVQSLFADGHIKYSAVPISNTGVAKKGFKVLSITEQIIPDSQQDMSWTPASWGMKMTLSREVPAKIGSHLRGFISRMIKDSGHELADVLKNSVFAVHPGGPKIIDSVREVLELNDEQVAASRQILFERGNMSSATLPHVWQRLLDQNIPSKKLVVSLAFGPGLTIFGGLFESL